MPKKPSSPQVKKPAAKKAARKTVVRNLKKSVKKAVKKAALKKVVAPRKKTAKEPVLIKRAKASPEKRRSRAKVIDDHPDNIAIDANDHAAHVALDRKRAARPVRASRKRSPADRINDPPPGETPSASMVERVSDAIERELSKIEGIIGNPTRLHPTQRIETESRARVLASLARTLKEVMRLREQERGDDKTKAADDDAVPRDLDEFRRELSRRLEGLVAIAAPLPAGGNDAG